MAESSDRSIYPLQEERSESHHDGEEEDASLVGFFVGLPNVDVNASLRSYLSSRGSNSRRISKFAMGGNEISDPNTVKLPTSDSTNLPPERTLESRTSVANSSEGGPESVKFSLHLSSTGGSLEGGSVTHIVQALRELMSAVGHAQDAFSQCGVSVKPLTSLNDFLSLTQSHMRQLLESAINGRGLVKRSAKMELVRVAIKSTSQVLSALMEIMALMVQEASTISGMRHELAQHQRTLLEEQAQVQEALQTAKRQMAVEQKLGASRVKPRKDKLGVKPDKSPGASKAGSKPIHVTKYIASNVPGRAESISVLKTQQHQQKLENMLTRKEQDNKRMNEAVRHANSELTSAKEKLAELRHHNEFLEAAMRKNVSELRHRLKVTEDELASKTLSLKNERRKMAEVTFQLERSLGESQRMSTDLNSMHIAVEHLKLVISEQRKREERLRQQLSDSQSSVKALEDALKTNAKNLIQKKDVERKNRQEQSKLRQNAKKMNSPLAELKFPEIYSKSQPAKPTKKSMFQMSVDVHELRELAHFNDDHSAKEVLHWLKKEM